MSLAFSKLNFALARPAAAAPPRADAGHSPRQRTRVPLHELANVTAQLAIMMRSGVDVASALQTLARQVQQPALARVLGQLYDDVLGGRSFTAALRLHPQVFSGTYIAIVAAGEASGDMPTVLTQLAELQRSEIRLRRSIRGLLMYPILLTSVSSLVILGLVVFVLPRFADLFEQYNTPLPVLTQALLAVASEFRARWFLWGPVVLAALAGAVAIAVTPRGRALRDRILIQTAGIRDVTRALLVGRSCRLIGLMIESGVPLLDSIRLTRDAVHNSVFKQVFDRIEESVINGGTMATALGESSVVPPGAVAMLATAERTGKLAEVTSMIGRYYEEEGEARTRQTVAIIEPLMTVVMGVVVAVVVLAVMLPVFDIATFAGQGH